MVDTWKRWVGERLDPEKCTLVLLGWAGDGITMSSSWTLALVLTHTVPAHRTLLGGHGGGWQHLFGGDVRRDQARPRAPESGETEPQANWVSEFLHHVPLICWISLTKLRFWDCDCRALNLKRGVPLWAPGSVWLCRSRGPEPAQVIISWGFREILQGSHFYSHSATEETKALCSLCQALGKQR